MYLGVTDQVWGYNKGPWWHVAQAVSYPDQYIPMLPSISQNSLAVNVSACESQFAACPLPVTEMWTPSASYRVRTGLVTQSGLQDAAVL